MPGAMMLRARQNPQNRNQKKFAFTSTENSWNPISTAKITIMHTIMEMKEPLLRPCSPASRNREGSMPVISPMKTHTDGSGYFSRKKERMFATPRIR